MVFSRNTRTYLACIGYGVVGLTNTVFGAVLSPVAGDYGVSLAVAGLLVSLQYMGFVIAGPLSGELVDRLGQRLVIPSGYVLTALGLVLFGAARWWPLALAAALLVGLGFGICGTSVNAFVADLNPDRRGWAIGLVQFSFGCGSVVSPFVAAGLLAGDRSWRLLFALDALMTLGALLLFVYMLHGEARGSLSRPARQDGMLDSAQRCTNQAGAHLEHIALWRVPGLTLLALALAAYMGIQAGLTAWIAPYIQRSLGADPALAALGAMTFWVGLTSGRLASSFVGERAGYGRTVVGSAGLGLLLLVGFVSLRDEWLAVGGALVVGLAYGACFPMILAAGGQLLPNRPGAATGTILAFGSVGAALFPWIAGYAAGDRNQVAALGVLIAVGVLLLALACWFVRQSASQRRLVVVPAHELGRHSLAHLSGREE